MAMKKVMKIHVLRTYKKGVKNITYLTISFKKYKTFDLPPIIHNRCTKL